MTERGATIGIDLGTTYSCVGVWQNDGVEIILNDQGNRITPSYVAFTDKERLIGDGAINQVEMNPTNTVFGVKRLIGKKFSDSSVQTEMKQWPFKVKEGLNDKPMIQVDYKGEEKKFLPEQISAMVLTKMRETAEEFLGSRVTDAVVTVPAYFTDSQRQATKDAGKIAGLNILRIINEPTAAGFAYGFNKRASSVGPKNVLIFDLGGGTFDVSLLTINKIVFKVRATAGEPHLGGEDFNNRMASHFVQEFHRKHKKDISGDPKALRRLIKECEKAKRILSTSCQANIEICSLQDGVDFKSTISRAKFEQLNMDLFNKCLEPVQKCLRDAKMDKGDVDEIVLIGGSTRIPKVRSLLHNFFDGKQLCMSMNPEEAVAYGAALQASILSGADNRMVSDWKLSDVTPHTLGIDVVGGKMFEMIPRNTPIPHKATNMKLTTSEDYQRSVKIQVYEGESDKTSENNLLGEFKLEGIPPEPRNYPNLSVVFDLDANGILTVSAKDEKTRNKGTITIATNIGRLPEAEIERLARDCERSRLEDEENKKKIEARNKFEEYLYRVKQAIETDGVELSSDEEREIRDFLGRIFQTLDNNHLLEIDDINREMQNLEIICDPITRMFV